MKKICVLAGILISLLVTGIVVNAKQSQMQQELAEEVFRFHVLANSDSKEDQALKMQVKEAVIAYMKEEIPCSDSVETTKDWARSHLDAIVNLAEAVIMEEGYAYEVMAEVTTCDFPEKTYGDITFPAGEYEALRIEIGEAKGQNWWCVLYPNLCFIDAVHAVVPEEGKKDLKKVLEEDTYEMVTATTRFRIGWFFF
ncbi:MAG: stage II sporulation protein R [Tyzzerella sp.]|nr:stage II sporulation protein R [Tyzzerella sp.]